MLGRFPKTKWLRLSAQLYDLAARIAEYEDDHTPHVAWEAMTAAEKRHCNRANDFAAIRDAALDLHGAVSVLAR